MKTFFEVNFDGLVGANHNYAGLAEGNLASSANRQKTSNPRQAALQGLQKMTLLMNLGLKQGVVPPQMRPDFKTLAEYGYKGSEKNILDKISKEAPHLLATVYSSSSMWCANCATISPSPDTSDNKLHITPANLVSNPHRKLEAEGNYNFLNLVFSNTEKFTVHKPLSSKFPDEGAANHCRLTTQHAHSGLELFVYGGDTSKPQLTKYKPRQDLTSSKEIIKNHKLKLTNTILAQQAAKAIDAGVFHNDVICTANENLLLLHQFSFEHQSDVIKTLQQKFKENFNSELMICEIKNNDLPLEEAVSSYFFNTQIITLPDNSMTVIAPLECEENKYAKNILDSLIESKSRISKVIYTDLRQSMQNGGGPACLRLRVPMSQLELDAIHQEIIFNDSLHQKLTGWINKHYREELSPNDLADYQLVNEIRTGLDELTQILKLGSFYDFQKN